jgi:hypothetical protein
MDRLTLDARTLLVAARAVGLSIDAAGDHLTVRGPKGAAALARLLVERKPDMLAALKSEHSAGLTLAPEAPISPPPWPPRPDELAHWPIPWRERWGRLANELQDQGVPWPEYERLAFGQAKAELRKR